MLQATLIEKLTKKYDIIWLDRHINSKFESEVVYFGGWYNSHDEWYQVWLCWY